MRSLGLAIVCLLVGPYPAPTGEVKAKTGMAVWDTGTSTAPLAAALSGKNDWAPIPAGQTAAAFQGDAVVSNGRIVAVLRKNDAVLEVHALKPDGAIARIRLRL